MKATEEQKEILAYKIDSEGFDYCFNGYSDWEEIEDEEFHKLRKEYLKARSKFNEYLELELREYLEDL